MSIEIVSLIFIAFICELLDSSLGMLYGTILSPVLIIAGYEPLVVIPSILFSQAIGGSTAALMHQRLKNVDFAIDGGMKKKVQEIGLMSSLKASINRDLKVVFVITSLGILATILAALIAINVPKDVLKTYIGILVLLMGMILLLGIKFEFTWKNIIGLGLLSSFNKGMSGGGFGPVVTSGQILTGRESKNSIAATTLAEAPICITGFLTFYITKGLATWNLVWLLSIGSILGAIVGPNITAKFRSERKVRILMGIIVTILGIWTLVRTWLM